MDKTKAKEGAVAFVVRAVGKDLLEAKAIKGAASSDIKAEAVWNYTDTLGT